MLCQKKGNFPLAHLLKAFWTDQKTILKPNTTQRIVMLKSWSYCFLNSAERGSIQLREEKRKKHIESSMKRNIF